MSSDGETIWNLIERNLAGINRIAVSTAQKYGPLTRNEAEDLAQSAIMRVYEISEREPLSFASDGHFLAWMKSVLTNIAREQLRRARASSFSVDSIALGAKEPREQLDDKQRENLLAKVAALREPYRVVVELALAGLSPIEIAEYLELEWHTVRKRLSRATKILRAWMDE
ncbi:MAG: sigma-70 family RNA polymerase sigma factor [Planctomycetota bacterium]|nr:sigma-70 family RNA polymerase sigma factor [Planctomycetota bacterium]